MWCVRWLALALFITDAFATLQGEDVEMMAQLAQQRQEDSKARKSAVPVVLMHGMGDFASNRMGMVPLRDRVAKETGGYARNAAICSKSDKLDGCMLQDLKNGFLMPMDEQVEHFALMVRSDPNLSEGFNAIGMSQGSLIIRGYISRYNSPPVKSFVSLHGPMMGVAGIPGCPMNIPGLGVVCKIVNGLLGMGVYLPFVQNHVAQANYFRDPKHLNRFRNQGHFLPRLNNEVKGQENKTASANFKTLTKLVLVMAAEDTMVLPKESELFGYFKEGSLSEVVAMENSEWYAEDWFGLKTLDKAGKIDCYITAGDHLEFTDDFFVQMVRKYLMPAEVLQI